MHMNLPRTLDNYDKINNNVLTISYYSCQFPANTLSTESKRMLLNLSESCPHDVMEHLR